MDIKENMYAGFGKILLALALSDGKVDRSEVRSMENNIDRICKEKNIDLGLANIVFKVWEKSYTPSPEKLLEEGIHEFHLGDHYLTPKLASVFRTVLIDLAEAEPPITFNEEVVMLKFMAYLKEREEYVANH